MIKVAKLSAPLALTLLLAFTGCGDDDGGGPSADAMNQPTIDAMNQPQIDAMNVTTEALGTTCTPATAAECVAEAPACLAQQGAANGFCSLSCGQTADPGAGNDAIPPGATANAMCAAAYTGTATAVCNVQTTAVGTGAPIDWFCGLLCGTGGGMDFGTCESNLTCSASNFCEP